MCTEVLTHLLHLPGTAGGKGGGQLFLSYLLGLGRLNSQRQPTPLPDQSPCIAKGYLNRKGTLGKGFL